MTEPILIPCEGSNVKGHDVMLGGNVVMCMMCGQMVAHRDGVTLAHQRDDILTRIDRGDFG